METKDLQSLENLIKGYRELEEENARIGMLNLVQEDMIKELEEITNKYDAFANDYMPNDVKMIIADREYFNNGVFKENFIPKSKVKEIIENWKNQSTYYGSNIVHDLQELMEE
jgi:hypothetical protein